MMGSRNSASIKSPKTTEYLPHEKYLCLAASVCRNANSAFATEGMFTPDQLPDIAKDLRQAGLKLNPDQMTDLTAFPILDDAKHLIKEMDIK